MIIWLIQNAIADDHGCQQEFSRYQSSLLQNLILKAKSASKNFFDMHITEEILFTIQNYLDISDVNK